MIILACFIVGCIVIMLCIKDTRDLLFDFVGTILLFGGVGLGICAVGALVIFGILYTLSLL